MISVDEILDKLKDLLSEEEIWNLIIQEEENRKRQQENHRRPELQIPLYPPEPYPEMEPEPDDEEQERGVIIIDM